MMYLVTGGSGSGKSEYAENYLVKIGKKLRGSLPLYYVATMIPYGEEGHSRVAKHRNMRRGKGFTTLECYQDLHELKIPENRGIILECLSNLVANECFPKNHGPIDKNAIVKKVLYGIRLLHLQTDHLVIVTNEICSDHIEYDYETELYREILGKINQELADNSDFVVEVVYGIPIKIKDRRATC